MVTPAAQPLERPEATRWPRWAEGLAPILISLGAAVAGVVALTVDEALAGRTGWYLDLLRTAGVFAALVGGAAAAVLIVRAVLLGVHSRVAPRDRGPGAR